MSPSAATGLDSGDDQEWSDPTNVYSQNATHANVHSEYNGVTFNTEYLKATGYGFSIPGGATVTGIKVEVFRQKTAAYPEPSVVDHTVKLIVGGTVVGNNKAVAGEWPNPGAYQTYGGEGDLWGLTPTAAEVNASNFGVAIKATVNDAYDVVTAEVDHARITVYYTA